VKKVLKWIGIVLGGLVVLLVIAVASLYLVARGRLNRDYEVQVEAITIPTDEASLARGQHLVETVSDCTGCHGEDLGGTPFFDDPMVGVVYSSNLTAGEGGVGAQFTDEDWVRAIRHGVRPTGKPLLVMPSQHFYRYSDEDLGAMIAYLKSVPAVDRESGGRQLTVPAHVLMALGQFGPAVIPAEVIDHEGPHPEPPQPGVTEAYGEHLSYVATCHDCHGAELNGGQAGPGEPIAPNLTPGGELSDWSEANFMTLMRTGTTPTGRQVDDFMPWRAYQNMTDEELQAIWLYLQTLEPLETFTP
jgi:cytochrome c553